MLEQSASSTLETSFGTFEFFVYREKKSGKEHIALTSPWASSFPLVRIHSECATGDIFASKFCDCRSQLQKALKLIGKKGGALLYLRQEGRGLGLTEKIKAYELQRKGFDTVEANRQLGRQDDEREYDVAAYMLHDLGIQKMKLLTNNPRKIKFLKNSGFQIIREPLVVETSSGRAKKYLRVKKEKMGHVIDS